MASLLPTVTRALRSRVARWVSNSFPAKAISLSESFNSFTYNPFRTTVSDAIGITAVYACIDVLSKDVAKLPLIVYKRLPRGRGREIAYDHPLVGLLRRPNNWMTEFDWLRFLVASMYTAGNAYNVIIRSGSSLSSIIPVYPSRISLLLSQAGEVFYQVSRGSEFETAQLKTEPLYIPARDMLHVKTLTLDGFRGMPPLEVARNAVDMASALQTHGINLFRKGARPGGVLEAPAILTQEAITHIRESWEQAVTGDNAGGIAILEAGLKYNSLGLNSVDAQFLESRKFQNEEIARIFGVPLYRIQSLDRATWSNVENLSRDYVDNTLLPILENIEAAMGAVFNLEPDYEIEFDVDRLLRADVSARFSTYATARQWGIYNANEIRAKEGANPIEGGETYFAPMNMTDQRMIGKPPPAPVTPAQPALPPFGDLGALEDEEPEEDEEEEEEEGEEEELTTEEARELVNLVDKGMLP